MDDNLLEIICCPETHQPLRHADAELVTDLNQRIEAGTLLDRVEEKVGQKIDGGLLREDGKILYPHPAKHPHAPHRAGHPPRPVGQSAIDPTSPLRTGELTITHAKA